MHMDLAWGRQSLAIDLPEARAAVTHRQPVSPAVPDPADAMRAALDHPVDFPPLRRALIPDDHVTIAVDESLPQLPKLLVALLEYLQSAGILPQAITLVCQPPSTGQPWIEDLPEAFQDVHIEVHDPSDRRRLSYLATTRRGRRIYLNRSAVDADQLILLTRRSYNTLLGYAGGEGDLFPGLADDATRKEAAGQLTFDAPGKLAWPLQQEAVEVAWYLGSPFLVQVVEAEGAEIAGVVSGPIDSSTAGQQLLDARWRVEVDSPVDVVVAGLGGDPAQHAFLDLARAFACAARVVRPGGKVVLLTEAGPELGRSAELMRLTEDPGKMLSILAEEKPVDHEAGFLWAHAAQQAKLYLLSKLPDEVAEELFVVPMGSASDVRRIIVGNATTLFLPDAHKTMAVVKPRG